MKTISLLLALTASPMMAAMDDLKLDFHGAGWLQGGRVEESFKRGNAGNDYNKNWIGQSGGLVTVHSQVDEQWDAALGLGTVLVQLARGARDISGKWYPFWVSWVDEARVTRTSTLFTDSDKLQLTLGTFHFGYNPDSKNLGMYLAHGYVYPGAIVSPFTGPLGVWQAISGIDVAYSIGGFKNNLIAKVESDMPLYDISLIDVVTYKVNPAFEFGAGVNFYRAIPSNSNITDPGTDCKSSSLGGNGKGVVDGNQCYILIKDDSGKVIDSIPPSLQGTKLMARWRLDPKAFSSSEGGMFGKDDFVFYGELAVLGTKDYPVFYDNIARRIPIMFGLNLPGFNYLNWSVEAEFYASKISTNNIAARNGSAVPIKDDASLDRKRDDWKYSLNVSKMLGGNAIIMGQVANDHLRMGGNHDQDTGVETLRTLSDWYWTTKIAYFF